MKIHNENNRISSIFFCALALILAVTNTSCATQEPENIIDIFDNTFKFTENSRLDGTYRFYKKTTNKLRTIKEITPSKVYFSEFVNLSEDKHGYVAMTGKIAIFTTNNTEKHAMSLIRMSWNTPKNDHEIMHIFLTLEGSENRRLDALLCKAKCGKVVYSKTKNSVIYSIELTIFQKNFVFTDTIYIERYILQ